MSNMKENKDNVFKSREFLYFVLAFVCSVAILGSFWYGGHTACKLGGGYYYKFACVDVRVVEIPAPQDIRVYDPSLEYDCSSPLFEDNYVLCPIENLTKS